MSNDFCVLFLAQSVRRTYGFLVPRQSLGGNPCEESKIKN